jgi:hypothetical protein
MSATVKSTKLKLTITGLTLRGFSAEDGYFYSDEFEDLMLVREQK